MRKEPGVLNIYLPAFILYLATVLSQLATIVWQATPNVASVQPLLLPSLLVLSAITIPAILIGQRLGKPLGLGIESGVALQQGVTSAVLLAIPLGCALLVLRCLLLPWLPAELPEYGFRGPTGGLLVSVSAGIGEEVWFRYGLMTLVLWLVFKARGSQPLSSFIVVCTIIGVGILFGLAHLPQLASFGAASNFAISATILGNVLVSVLYGWCFWRYGLISAMAAHISLDIVLHMLPAFF